MFKLASSTMFKLASPTMFKPVNRHLPVFTSYAFLRVWYIAQQEYANIFVTFTQANL